MVSDIHSVPQVQWGGDRLSTNAESMIEKRAMESHPESEQWLVQPTAIEIDEQGRIIIVDRARHRL